MINEELKETAIAEYMAEFNKERSRNFGKTMRLAVAVVAGILVAATVIIPSYIYVLAGRYEDGVIKWTIGLIVVTAAVTPAVLIVWFVLRNNLRKTAKEYENELRKTTWHISEGYLIKEIKGDRRRTRRFKLEEISNAEKENNLITIEYKNEEIPVLDFYDPPLYDSLKEMISE